MSMQCADTLEIDAGEEIHITCTVKPKCGYHVPFAIKEAKYQLINKDGLVIKEGECKVQDHDIDAFVQLPDVGTFWLKYIYKIADETWVDKIKLRVG